MVDQSPIGRTPRANPVTYVKAYDGIRNCSPPPRRRSCGRLPLVRSPLMRLEGAARRVRAAALKRSRCNFFPIFFVTCPACDGARFRQEVLEVTFRDKTIADVLQLTVAEALVFLRMTPRLRAPCSP